MNCSLGIALKIATTQKKPTSNTLIQTTSILGSLLFASQGAERPWQRVCLATCFQCQSREYTNLALTFLTHPYSDTKSAYLEITS